MNNKRNAINENKGRKNRGTVRHNENKKRVKIKRKG